MVNKPITLNNVISKQSLLAAGTVLIGLSSISVQAASSLVDYSFNTDGTVTMNAAPGGVDISAFSTTTGLGSITATITGSGAHTFDAFFDHEIDEAINTFFNETATTSGVAAAGQSWELDEPGWVNGDIFENFQSSALDNGIGTSIFGNTAFPDDVSMAIGWDFTLASTEAATIDILLSQSIPGSGFFLTHTDPDSLESIYLSSTLSISQVPVPAAIWLLGSGFLGLIGVARRKQK